MKLAGLLAAMVWALAAPALTQADPHQWLEGAQDPKALEWVARENARSTAALRDDPRYRRLHDEALELLTADDRTPAVEFIGRSVFNFWRNEEHVRGVWRRTPLKDYARRPRQWEVVLDIDRLAKAEKANWVWKGSSCVAPAYRRCLVYLSDGGKDAVEVREFDLGTRRFVDGGFRFPEGKQTVEWLDPDTVIFTRAADAATESGYGYIVRTLKRGQPIARAVEVFRGQPSDVSVSPRVLRDGQGRQAVILERGVEYFRSEYHLLTDDGPKRLVLPERLRLHGLLDGLLIFTVAEDWKWRGLGETHPAGSLVAYMPEMLVPVTGVEDMIFSNQASRILEPGPRQSIEDVQISAGRVVVSLSDNLQGKLFAFTNNGEWGWEPRELPGAANAAIAIKSVSDIDDQLFYTVEGFVTPTELKLADAATGRARTTNVMPARFASDDLVVEQHEVASKDGTLIPYFLIRHRDAPLDGSAPTLLHGYGGFQVSKTPAYDPIVGKLWLERGGAYALANIRGGGEFGPAWHQAALNGNRQRAYDDFFAVAEDLIARKVTSPRRLGIYGRSNGGLLMGVAMTQRPELFNAVVIESPLLDMLRYHELPAGASWIGEYGDPRIPEEAAWLAGYSPYQALKPGVAYPPAYITTNTKDDRVHPGHARKFAARLDELGVPHLYFENTEGGHANSADPPAEAVRWGMHYTYLMQRLMD